jgi:uncharacterized membrane protein
MSDTAFRPTRQTTASIATPDASPAAAMLPTPPASHDARLSDPAASNAEAGPPKANRLDWLFDKLPATAPDVAAAARKAAGQLKDKVKDLDLRRRISDLKKTQQPHRPSAAPHGQTPERISEPTQEPDLQSTRNTLAEAVTQPAPQPVRPRSSVRMRPLAPEGLSWMSWTFVSGCIFAAGVAHIVTVFALPMIGATGAYERLKPLLPVNTMTTLPVLAPGATPLPFLSPDLRYAMCRYDLSQGSVVVSATLPEAGWSLAIHTPDGENFYLVSGQDQRRTDVTFTITRSGERSLIALPGVRRSDVDATQVTSPRMEGLVVLRAPIRGVAYRGETEALFKTATCRQQTR